MRTRVFGGACCEFRASGTGIAGAAAGCLRELLAEGQRQREGAAPGGAEQRSSGA